MLLTIDENIEEMDLDNTTHSIFPSKHMGLLVSC